MTTFPSMNGRGWRRLLGVFLAGGAALTASAEEFTWTGTANGYWGGVNWNDGSTFAAGGDAVFADAATASVLVDADVTANRITANDDTAILPGAIDPDAWKTAYRYYRFCIDGTKSNDGMMQLSDIMLLDAGGNEISSSEFTFAFDPEKYNQSRAYPPDENPTNAVDGARGTKWLDYRAGNSRTSVERAAVWLEFRFSSPRNLSGYRWYTANDADSRDPAAWRLLASHDGVTWVTLDKVTGFNPPTERKALAFQRSFAGFSKYRFKVDETKNGYGTMQISDVALYGLDGMRLLAGSGADFTVSYLSKAADGGRTYPGGENPDCAVDVDRDGNAKTGTKWLDWRLEREETRDEVWIQFNMTTPVNISAYSWSTGNDTAGWTDRNLRAWRLMASNDGETWAPLDVVSGASPTTANETEAYRKTFVADGMSFKVAELEVGALKTLCISGGIDVSHSGGISKTGGGTLKMGGGEDLTVRPANGFDVCEGVLEATDVVFRLGGTKTANHDAPFVVGDCGGGEATAVLNGGSVYCVSPGSGVFNAMQIGANEGDTGRLYATNANVTTRGRLRLATGAESTAYVEKVGGDWSVEEANSYGQFRMGEGLNGSSEFYHRSGTLTVFSYICVGSNGESTGGRNYFEIDGGTVSQGHYAKTPLLVGWEGKAGVHNELCVKGGTLVCHTQVNVCDNAPGVLTIDGGEVNAQNGQVRVSCSGDSGKEGAVALNGGTLTTIGVVHGGGAERGTLVFDGGTLKASAAGTLVGGGKLEVSVGERGGMIDNNGKDVTIEAGFGGAGTIELAGAGTTEFAEDQPEAEVSFVLREGVVKLDEGVAVASPLAVATGARLAAPFSTTTQSAVSNLAFAAGATLGLAPSCKAIAVDAVTMPESGTVALASAAGAPLDMGRYEVLASAKLPDGLEARFEPIVADGLQASFTREGGILILTVSGGNEAVWTGDEDGDLANPNNWFLRMTPDGRPAVVNVAAATTLTCSSTISPTSITFSEGSAAVTIEAEHGLGISGVQEIVNRSSSVQTFNVPVAFAQDVTLECAEAPVCFAGGVAGRTLVLKEMDAGDWHLRGEFNLSYWEDSPCCFIDDGTTVNAGAASGLGEVRIEAGGSLVVGDYTLNVADGSEDAVKWALYYNKGLFKVTNAFTNISSVKASMFSGDNGAEMGADGASLEDKPKNVIANLVNNPVADVDFLLGKYGDPGTGYSKWVRAAYQFGSVTWNSRQSRIVTHRGNSSSFYFANSGDVSGDWENQSLGFLEDTTFNMCDLEAKPSEMVFDCDIVNEPYGSGYYCYFTIGGGGKFTLARGRKLDMHTELVTVSGEKTTLALVPGAAVRAKELSIHGGSTLELAGPGAVIDGNLRLEDGARLKFDFAERAAVPALELADGKTLAAAGAVTVTVAGETWPTAGAKVLAATGGFNAEGVTVALDPDHPAWVKSLFVNDDGNLVLEVKPRGSALRLK